MKHLVSPFVQQVIMLGLLLFSYVYFEQHSREEIRYAETALQERGMPADQVRVIAGALRGVSRSAFSFAQLAGFMGIILGVSALHKIALNERRASSTDKSLTDQSKWWVP